METTIKFYISKQRGSKELGFYFFIKTSAQESRTCYLSKKENLASVIKDLFNSSVNKLNPEIDYFKFKTVYNIESYTTGNAIFVVGEVLKKRELLFLNDSVIEVKPMLEEDIDLFNEAFESLRNGSFVKTL